MKNFLILLVLVGVGGYFGAKFYLHKKVGDGMDMAVLMMSPYADVEYDGVRSTLTGELTVEDIRVRVDGYTDDIMIDRFGIDTPSFLSLLRLGDLVKTRSDNLPDSIGFLVEGVHLESDADYYRAIYDGMLTASGMDDVSDPEVICTGRYGFSPEALEGLGYDEQVVSTFITFHNGDGSYDVDLALSARDMWDIDVNVTLAGNLMTEIMRGSSYKPRLSRLDLKVTDRSLNRRVSRYCAELGLSKDDIVKAQLDSFRYQGAQNGIEFDDYVLGPYVEYINGKSTLVITARPSEPIAFSQIDLYKPSDVPALLNLEATAL